MILRNVGVPFAMFSVVRDRLIPDEPVHIEQVEVLVVIKILLLGANWLNVVSSEFPLSVWLPCPFALIVQEMANRSLNRLKFVVEFFIHLGELVWNWILYWRLARVKSRS